jgi:hypothetical protein
MQREQPERHHSGRSPVPSDSTVADSNGAGKYQTEDHQTAPSGDSREVTYDYTDETGSLLFQVIRTPGKQFIQRHPGRQGANRITWADNEWKPQGGRWYYRLDGVRRVIYRLPEVKEAIKRGDTVWIAEGEKDADSLVAAGVTATCNPGGALKWSHAYSPVFRYADVVIVRDRDDVGHEHARRVAASLRGVASSIRIVEAAEGKDATDHLAAGQKLDDFRTVEREQPAWASLFVAGGSFILDAPKQTPSIWGERQQVIWAQGEALTLVGPQGIGKTTLAQQLTLARLGLQTEVLGFPVVPGMVRVLYLAMDRPRQVQRSFARMVTDEQRVTLDRQLIVWKGPLPDDLQKNPKLLLEMCQAADADTVVVDSLKDAAPGLDKPAVAAAYNQARQFVIAADIEMVELNHQRKSQGGSRPKTLDDVYGGFQLTAGAGSVVLLWGEPGASLAIPSWIGRT